MKKVITIIMISIFVSLFTLTASSYVYLQKPHGYFQLTPDVQNIVDEAMEDAYNQALEDVENALSMKTYYELPWEIQNLIKEIENKSTKELEDALSMKSYYELPWEIQDLIEEIEEDAYNKGYEDAKNNFSSSKIKNEFKETSKQTVNIVLDETENNSTTNLTTTKNTTAQSTETDKFNSLADFAPYILLAFVTTAFIVYIIVNKKKNK